VKASRRPRFLLDLEEELLWLKEHAGADVAARWYEALTATVELIKRNPQIGRERKDLKPPGVRSWRLAEFPRWLIFYMVTEKQKVVFLRVRSATMNLVVMKMES
jgi:plasmid stabilization system protein ParE